MFSDIMGWRNQSLEDAGESKWVSVAVLTFEDTYWLLLAGIYPGHVVYRYGLQDIGQGKKEASGRYDPED